MLLHEISLIDNSKVYVTIHVAVVEDLENLIALNIRWQKTNLGQNIEDGYIGAAFSRLTFNELVNRHQVVVTEFENTVVGYYLINNVSKDGVIGRHEEIVTNLKSMGVLNLSQKIYIGGQVVVERKFMGSGIRQLMLRRLSEVMKGKCNYFFGTIAKDNPRALKAHPRDGWVIVGEEQNLIYVVYKI